MTLRTEYLRIVDLSVWYGSFQALKGLTLSVRQGELFTFLGPSGSGKSTILLCIAGFVPPKTGSVILDGRELTYLPPNKRQMGMVFQSYALFPHKTVFGNVAYGLQVRKFPRSEVATKVRDLLKMVQLEGSESKMPHQLSGGQQQRVALARALAFNPQLLLLDEPLGSLDKKLREQMEVLIRSIQRDTGSTTLYVTHDQNEAMTISDRIAILRAGSIVQIGTPREIYDNPASPFVADFIGGANFIRVRVLDLNEKTCVVESDGSIIRGIPKPIWLEHAKGWATLMVRPSHLRALPGEVEQENEVPCHVQESYYLGEVNVVRCVLNDQSRVEVRQPIDSEPEPSPQTAARLMISPARARLFEDSTNLEATKSLSKGELP